MTQLAKQADVDTTCLYLKIAEDLYDVAEQTTVTVWKDNDERERIKIMNAEIKAIAKKDKQEKKNAEMQVRIAAQEEKDKEALAKGEIPPSLEEMVKNRVKEEMNVILLKRRKRNEKNLRAEAEPNLRPREGMGQDKADARTQEEGGRTEMLLNNRTSNLQPRTIAQDAGRTNRKTRDLPTIQPTPPIRTRPTAEDEAGVEAGVEAGGDQKKVEAVEAIEAVDATREEQAEEEGTSLVFRPRQVLQR